MEEMIFNYLMRFSDSNYLNYAKTDDYFSIGGICSVGVLKNVLMMLDIQNEYEVFIETERVGSQLIYSVAGTKIK